MPAIKYLISIRYCPELRNQKPPQKGGNGPKLSRGTCSRSIGSTQVPKRSRTRAKNAL